jgi:imidazolonepropionase-like amidohydrolase
MRAAGGTFMTDADEEPAAPRTFSTPRVARACGFFVVVAALVAGAGCASAHAIARLDPAEPVAFVDITVIDGTGGPPLRHQDVVVAGDRISSIAPTGAALDARAIDGRGKTLLPGFVDAHAHISGGGVPAKDGSGLGTDENLQRWLLAGVTTVFDMSGAAPAMGDLAERLDDYAIAGPRLFHTHLVITGKGAHPIPLSKALVPFGSLASWVLPQVEDDDDIDRVLDEADELLVDYVKIAIDRMPKGTPQLERGLMERLVKEARKRGHLVFVHAGDVDDAVAAAEAGATALAHLPWRGELTAEKAQRLKDSGVVVVTTVAMWDALPRAIAGDFTPSAADRDLIPKEIIATAEHQRQVDPEIVATGEELAENHDNRERSFQALLAAGVPLLVGTDASIPAVWPGSGYVNELQALLAHGLPVNDLIVAMTSRPAHVVAGANSDFGVIQTGKCADLVVVDGDPLVDPSALWRISLVLRGGHIVSRLPPPGR